jgi:hypothetical protein
VNSPWSGDDPDEGSPALFAPVRAVARAALPGRHAHAMALVR